MFMPSAWCCALQSNGRSIRRVSASRLRSTGWRPSAIASTIRGERNPSGIRRHTERPSIPSRLAKSLTERTLPETSSLAQRLARATAFSNGQTKGEEIAGGLYGFVEKPQPRRWENKRAEFTQLSRLVVSS
jgi:hypothetical protein